VTADALVAIEGPLRLAVFAGLLAVLAIAERVRPLRGDARPARRQAVNLGLMLLDTLLLRIGFPVLAVGFAAALAARGIGLLPMLAIDGWVAVALAVLLLDLAIYAQHRVFHRVPALWRLHRVHHADTAFDVTLGVRFHPFEIALSMTIKFAVIAALGAPPLAVLLFELALSAGSLLTHADLRLPARLERVLRRVVVTPDMHRIHHSIHRDETDSNFAFHLSLWDRVFGTYRDAPRDAQATMAIGLARFREPDEQTLVALLLNPFRDVPADPPPTRPDHA
jgi:sterol desaturase/sphingolipid hydroxylase (fatty acid hydroxylase superfamily)